MKLGRIAKTLPITMMRPSTRSMAWVSIAAVVAVSRVRKTTCPLPSTAPWVTRMIVP